MNQTRKKDEIRIDKWLWAARFYKTRSQATAAVQAGKVKLNSRSVKPGHGVKVGDEILITRKLFKQHVRIIGLHDRRTSPKIASTLFQDLTPPEVVEEARIQQQMESAFYRERRGTGRPTKRARRILQKQTGKF